jgi:hypothetical protein
MKPLPTNQEALEALYHLECSAKSCLLHYYRTSPNGDGKTHHGAELMDHFHKAAIALGYEITPIVPASTPAPVEIEA